MFKKFVGLMVLVIVIVAAAVPAFAQDNALACDPSIDYAARGWALKAAGDKAGSVAAFDCAIQLDPTNARSFYGRGAVLCSMGQTAKALENYEQAIEIDPEYAMAWNNRGWANYLLGNYQDAMDSLNHALELDPQLHYAYNNRGLVYMEWNMVEQARADFEQAEALAIPHPWAEINLANLEFAG